MTSNYSIREKYTKGLNYEASLIEQLNRISFFHSNGDWDKFEYSVDALSYMIPKDIRDKVLKYKLDNNIKHNTNIEGRNDYIKLWEHINQLLEEANLIFSSSYIKTYE